MLADLFPQAFVYFVNFVHRSFCLFSRVSLRISANSEAIMVLNEIIGGVV